ncbi:hypothetical protein AAC387_Pa03g0001 [Persea americana]
MESHQTTCLHLPSSTTLASHGFLPLSYSSSPSAASLSASQASSSDRSLSSAPFPDTAVLMSSLYPYLFQGKMAMPGDLEILLRL